MKSSSSTLMFPPPQEAPMRKPAFLDESSCAQISSVSRSSSGLCSELVWKYPSEEDTDYQKGITQEALIQKCYCIMVVLCRKVLFCLWEHTLEGIWYP